MPAHVVRVAKHLGMDPHLLYFERPAYWLDYGAVLLEQDTLYEESQREAAARQ